MVRGSGTCCDGTLVLVQLSLARAGRKLQTVFHGLNQLGKANLIRWPLEGIAPFHATMTVEKPLLTELLENVGKKSLA